MPAVIEKPRKLQIRETAEQLFREKGYSATSMRNLAGELGIEPASLYSHIKSKEEILSSICFGMANAFFNSIKPVINSNEPAKSRLANMIVNHTNVVLKNVNASSVFFHDWKHLSEPKLSDFKKLRRDYENAFLQVLTEGNQSDEFQINDLPFYVKTLFSAMNMTHEWYKADGNMQGDQVGKQLAEFLINGILPKSLKS